MKNPIKKAKDAWNKRKASQEALDTQKMRIKQGKYAANKTKMVAGDKKSQYAYIDSLFDNGSKPGPMPLRTEKKRSKGGAQR